MKRIKRKISTYSTKKKIALSLLLLSIISMTIAGVYSFLFLSSDIVSDVETINPDGATGKAFVAYRPGISSFQKDMTYAFIEGLKDDDWRIDVTTISSQTPTDLSSYDLLVFGSPTYGGKPHPSVTTYFKKLGNLEKKNITVIVTSGQSNKALNSMESMVNDVNGTVVSSLVLFMINNEGGDASQISYQAGKDIV